MKLGIMLFISLKSSFCFWENQLLSFEDIQILWSDQMPKHKIRNTFY